MSRKFWPCQAMGQAATARSRMVSDGSGTDGRFGDLIDSAQAMALLAGTLWRVGREVFGIEHRLVGRVAAGARVEHANQARQGGDAAHR